MQNYVVVTVPQDLLPQVVGELLQFTTDANRVDVVHGPVGRVIHVDPLVAEAWLEFRREKEKADAVTYAEPEPVAAPEPPAAPAPEPEPAPAPPSKPLVTHVPAPAPAPAPVPSAPPLPPVTVPSPKLSGSVKGSS